MSLEAQARIAWTAWGAYAKYTRCHDCLAFTYCRSRRRVTGIWLCLQCWDQRAGRYGSV